MAGRAAALSAEPGRLLTEAPGDDVPRAWRTAVFPTIRGFVVSRRLADSVSPGRPSGDETEATGVFLADITAVEETRRAVGGRYGEAAGIPYLFGVFGVFGASEDAKTPGGPMLRRETLHIPVDDIAPRGVATVAARVTLDDAPRSKPPAVLCCFPGGGMTSRYFELAGHDMAAHLAAQGFVVVAIDHPGIGESGVPDDPWTLRPETTADVDATAARRAAASLGLDDAVLVGVGHSMGAMLVTYQQARHRLYRGVALLGFSGRGVPEFLTPDELAVAHRPDRVREAIADLARERFGRPLTGRATTASPMLNGPDTTPEVEAALREAATGLLTLCGLTSMIPGSHAHILSAIDVPVLLSIAEHDIAGPPTDAPRSFPAAEVTLHTAESAYHNSNIAPTRADIWDRVAQWVRALPGVDA